MVSFLQTPRSWNLRRVLPVGATVAVALAGAVAPVASAATAHHTPKGHPTSAPVLRVSGTVLKWNRVNKIRRYELATIRHPATTRNTTYRIVTGTSFKVASTRGETVKYGLRADVRNARWSKKVSVTIAPAHSTTTRGNAASGKTTTPGAVSPVTTTTTTPVTVSPVSTPTPVSLPAPAQKLVVSVMNTTGWGVDSIFAKAGINATRLDIGQGTGIGLLKTAIADGMHPLPVYTQGSDGNLNGLSPAQCATDIAAIVPQLKALGVTTLEFGNESYLTESAATYGAQYNAAHVAAQGSGIKLLAAATSDYYEHARGGSGSWFSDLVKALPGGAGEIDALTLHPYGSMTSVGSDGYGWPMVPALHAEAVAAGISPTLPWYFTEAGQEVSGGGIEGQAPVSQSVQASDVTQYLNDIKTKYTWVVYLDFYTCRDDSSGGFGLLNSDNTPRPAFTAVQNWVAANSTTTNG
jgi:hypothetical protein